MFHFLWESEVIHIQSMCELGGEEEATPTQHNAQNTTQSKEIDQMQNCRHFCILN